MDTSPELIIAIVFAAMKLFETVARITPTTLDDNWVQYLRRISALLGLALPDRQKDVPRQSDNHP